jgi:hypothetical protein
MSTTDPHDCERCNARLQPGELRCPACGTPRPGVDLPPVAPPAATTDKRASRGVIDNPYAVLAAVFFAMAILGIPLIWACRAWSPATKAVLTIVTIVYTAFLFWGTYAIVMRAVSVWREHS